MVGLSAAEGIAADALRGEIDLTAHQPEAPEGIHREGAAEEMDRAVFGRAPDVDHQAPGRRLEIQVPGGRDGAPGGARCRC